MISSGDCEEEFIYLVITMDYRNFPVFVYYHIWEMLPFMES